VQVFLSYRRSDAGGHAGRLADRLVYRLGNQRVFQDVTAIAPGEDFTAAIDGALDRSDAVLAVIGPGWLAATGPEGGQRLFEPGDYVHLELARALQRGVPVVPVLVGGATLPAVADLPEDLAGLVQRQAATLHDDTWHEDVDGLMRRLAGEVPGDRPRSRRPAVLAGAAAALVLVAGAVWWSQAGGDGGGSVDDLTGCPAATTGPAGTWHDLTPLASEVPVPADTGDEAAGFLYFTVKAARWRALDGGRSEVILDTQMENAGVTSHAQAPWRFDALVVADHEFPATCFSAADAADVAPRRKGDATIGFEVRCDPTSAIVLAVEDASRDLLVTDPGETVPC
jgi:hypothetical protein